MSVIKRDGSPYYYARFTAPNGRKVFVSTRSTSRRDAREFEANLKARYWRETQLRESQATWREAVVSWLQSTNHKDRAGVKQKLRWLDPHLGDKSLRDITASMIYDIRDAKLAEGVKPPTVNRYLAVISAVLNHARKRAWLESVPAIEKLEESEPELRWLTYDEADRLIEYLRARPRSQHLADMVEFSLATGLREANVTGLEWSRVRDRVAWVPQDQSKSGKLIRVPLNQTAREVLERRRGIHDRWVFTYRGKRIRKANREGFQSALDALGLHDVNWHTLRHTWASWHVMSGTSLQSLMELGGWSCYQMVLRYAHLADDHLSDAAENVCKMRAMRNEGKDENDVTD